jgi:hypothetical protein
MVANRASDINTAHGSYAARVERRRRWTISFWVASHELNLKKLKASTNPYHSFRIGFACYFLAAGCPPATIQTLARWRSVESLAIYARMNPADYTAWVTKAFTRSAWWRQIFECFRRIMLAVAVGLIKQKFYGATSILFGITCPLIFLYILWKSRHIWTQDQMHLGWLSVSVNTSCRVYKHGRMNTSK